jgi:hypothetical protein
MTRELRKLVLAFSLLVAYAIPAAANEPYLEESRQAYIASVLQAFEQASRVEIANTFEYLSVAERNHCRSSLSDLRTDCLLSYARKNCETAGSGQNLSACELYSDVIVINKLSTKAFVDRTERYRMLSNKDVDYRDALNNRLQQKYARIVTQFYLTEGADCGVSDLDCLSRGLDRFCADYANTQSLAWQYCVGASVWFIGTADPDGDS